MESKDIEKETLRYRSTFLRSPGPRTSSETRWVCIASGPWQAGLDSRSLSSVLTSGALMLHG